jgi:hypothetical protein
VPEQVSQQQPQRQPQRLPQQQPPALLRGCARLQLHGLPFVGPSNMHMRGGDAMEAGRDAMRAALTTRAHWGDERIVAVPVPAVPPLRQLAGGGAAPEAAVPVAAV